ncbi:MAG TPA: DUF5916 domain-containing protein [Thermoanaerobaculia bacterium]|nr:DUF5916 domain-containing protein [Thermoanaerobaculia bacterium]
MRPARALIVLLLTSIPLFAEEAPPPPPSPITITRTNGAISIDGDLSDPGWVGAATIDRFYETSPANNIPAKVKTIVHLTYDDRYFYIGVRAEDPDPAKIRAPYVERDGVVGTDDNIAVLLDTRNDKRSAIELRVNPRGIQGDAIFNDANSNEDFSPDFFFDTAAKIDSGGWSAEYRIPFSALRYPDKDPQTWNILVWRNYPREFRYAFDSAPLPRGSNCFVCHAHPMTGLTHLPEAGHVVAAPYVTAQRLDTAALPATGFESGNLKADGGLDLKWNPSATGAVDLTVNPDFSQVESDVAQITVNRRFAVFFPEKRPFFLEGFDLFDTPMPVAYTRTINSPRWGIRSTGKIGDSAYTVLVSQDRGGGVTLLPGPQGNDFALQDSRAYSTIARVRHDLGGSFVGAVLTDREVKGGGHNRVLGPDFQWRPNQSDALTGQLLVSDTNDPLTAWKSRSHAFIANWARLVTKYDAFVDVRDVGSGFRADLGFIPQAGYRRLDGNAALRFYPEGQLVSFVRPVMNFDYQTDRDGQTLFRVVQPTVVLLGAKNLQASFDVSPKEQVRVGSKLLEQTNVDWFVQFDPSRRFTRITFSGRGGQAINYSDARVGHGVTLQLAATVRPIDKITLDANLSRETLDEHGARAYTVLIERLKTTYSFSNNSLVRLIGQYVTTKYSADRNGDFNGSVLYSYRLNWQTVLFVGYGDDRVLLPDDRLVRSQRSFFTKISYAIQR